VVREMFARQWACHLSPKVASDCSAGLGLETKERNTMTQEQVKGLFALAGIDVLRMWELPNQYWPEAYVEERKSCPWWLIKTPKGLIEIGWRKRVISIDWSDTGIRKEITEDEVTKCETGVHAWGYEKALTYLKELARAF